MAAVAHFGGMCLTGMCTGASASLLLRWLGADRWRQLLTWRMVALISGCFGALAVLVAGLAGALAPRSLAALIATALAVVIGAVLAQLVYVHWRQVCLVLWAEAVRPSSSG